MDWTQHTGRKEKKFKYTYSTIASIVGLKRETLWKYARQKKFNPNDLLSVIDFINSRV